MEMARKSLLIALAVIGGTLISCVSVTSSKQGQNFAEPDFSTITKTELLENVRLLSHRNMAGRGTQDSGYEFPALFLERELREYGFLPLGDNLNPRSYLQKFQVANRLDSCNVIGYLKGKKRKEFVIIGAHYDHEGRGEISGFFDRDFGKGGSSEIYPGADDNASGTAAVLEVAEALGILAKRGIQLNRSVLIGFWGAEEHGLIGSEYFVKHLPVEVKLENIIAVLNLDMVGRNDSRNLEILATLPNKSFKEVCPELFHLVRTANRKPGLNFKLTHEDNPLQDVFMRSDGYSFYLARLQNPIPVLSFFTGLHEDYHRPSDTYEKINYPKLTRVARLAFLVVWEITKLPKRPRYRLLK